MKHLSIRNVGPVKEADIDLKRINVIIGPQGSGKSCVLKIACYCTWVEKRIAIEQSSRRFENGKFISELVRFHKLDNYIRNDSFIMYKSDLMRFSYDGSTDKFSFKWTGDKWNYRRAKISYIPAERNLMAVIPNWFEVEFPNNNIKNFLKDWESTRKSIGDFPILDLGVKYHYNSGKKTDEIKIEDNISVNFTNASSGYQSVIPLCLLVQFLFEDQFSKEKHESVEVGTENEEILQRIYRPYREKILSKYPIEEKLRIGQDIQFFQIDHSSMAFIDENDYKECNEHYLSYTTVDHSDVFIEEPELNLFPATQHELVNWLIGKAGEKHTIFISTHSPYIMTSLNNLIQAGNVIAEDESKREKVEAIVSRERILSYDEVGAFMIDADNVVRSMMDNENRLISAEKLDGASDVISEEFCKLLDL